MPISYPLDDFPVDFIAGIEIQPNSVVAISRSPYTGSQQVFAHAGQWWQVGILFRKMKRAEAEVLNTKLLKLNGMEGTFLLPPFRNYANRGSAATNPGTPRVSGNDQVGTDLTFNQAPAGQVGYLLEGDYISLGTGGSTRLFKVLETVNIDSAGYGTLVLWPKLRLAAPLNNDLLEVQEPQGVFRLATNVPSWSIDTALIYETSIQAIEAI